MKATSSTREGYNGIIKLKIKSFFLLLHLHHAQQWPVPSGCILKRRLITAFKHILRGKQTGNQVGASTASSFLLNGLNLYTRMCVCIYVENEVEISSV